MTLSIEIGHKLTGDVQKIPGKTVRFVAEDGHTMFEVTAEEDGKSIEIRTVDYAKVDGELYSKRMLIKPNAANSVSITVEKYNG